MTYKLSKCSTILVCTYILLSYARRSMQANPVGRAPVWESTSTAVIYVNAALPVYVCVRVCVSESRDLLYCTEIVHVCDIVR